MPDIAQHAPGSFCWIELSTTDQAAAKSFYATLFAWSAEDTPMGPSEYYTTFLLGGKAVAAAYTRGKEEAEMNVPPHWNLYVAVKSADESAKQAQELGGSVLAGPFDVMSYGRMAVVQDPNGAVFCMWEAKDHIGIQVERGHGGFCWADLSTSGQDEAQKFYGALFGWKFFADPGSGYVHIENDGRPIGGIPPDSQRNTSAPPHWMIYIQTDDCDATTATAQAAGARVYFGPVTIEETGRFTVFADPQGAVSALFQDVRTAR